MGTESHWRGRSWGLVVGLVAVFLVSSGCQSSPKPLPAANGRTYRSILEWAHQNGMPGAVLLVRTPETNFLDCIGYADLRQRKPMRIDHGFRVASTTKLFLGIAAAQLQAEGILDTSLTITNFLPASITDHIPNSDRITVRHLVRHTSGIYNYTESWRYQLKAFVLDTRGDWSPLRQIRYAFDKPAYFPPGEGFRYSNSNYLLLGMILDRVTGRQHAAEIRRRILEPLHLDHTYYEFYEPPHSELAHGYEKLAGFEADVSGWTSENSGDGGIVSTASDLAVFVRAVAATNSWLSPATRQLLKSQPSTNDKDRPWYPVLHYDFGVSAVRGAAGDPPAENPVWFFGHGGVTPGYLSMAFHEPREDITVVFLGSSKLFRVFDPHRLDRFQAMLGDALLRPLSETAAKPEGK